MAETLGTLSIISFVVAGIALAIAIVLWFIFEIPTVVGDLTGRTARKSIARMRAENEKTGTKKYKESKTNIERGKLTETMSGINRNTDDDRPETGLLAENRGGGTETEETGLLNAETSTVSDSEDTGLLVDENETVALGNEVETKERIGGKSLTMIEEVMLIHTEEVIEC